MNKKNYISLAKKSANIQINELKKIKKDIKAKKNCILIHTLNKFLSTRHEF